VTNDLRNPLKRARNIGSAKSGAGAWMAMQFTSVVLAGLSVWFVILVVSLMHAGYGSVRAAIGHPMNATLMATFVILACWHTELGLRNIYEDYIHTPWLAYWTLILTRLVLLLVTVLSLLSIVRLLVSH
jgi:succinate dehydrogenase / fumarate reductase membrane anchor subunit